MKSLAVIRRCYTCKAPFTRYPDNRKLPSGQRVRPQRYCPGCRRKHAKRVSERMAPAGGS